MGRTLLGATMRSVLSRPAWCTLLGLMALVGLVDANAPQTEEIHSEFKIIGSWLPRQCIVVRDSFRELGMVEHNPDDENEDRLLALWGTGAALKLSDYPPLAEKGRIF